MQADLGEDIKTLKVDGGASANDLLMQMQADLIGTPVIDADNGTVYGILSDIIENPANDLYEVKTKKGPVYLPAVKQFLIKLDPPDGIYVRPIPGMFTEAVWNDGKSDTPDTGTPDTGTGDDT